MMEELEELAKSMKERRILLQIPEGLKGRIDDFVGVFERHGKEVIVDLDPTYGACDVRIREKEAVGAEAIVHIGHLPMVKLPGVYYVEWKRELNKEAVISALKSLMERGKVCVATTANFGYILGALKELDGVVLGRGSWRVPYEGVVLGCDTTACDVNADLNAFIGDGSFHPMAIWINTRRPTFIIDPSGRVQRVSYEDVLKKRLALIGSVSGRKIGIIVSSKVGQNRRKLAFQLYELSKSLGYKPYLFVSDYLDPSYLLGLDVDFFVYTGCPRVPIDDAERYSKPLLTPEEFLYKVGLLKEYRIGWITELPRRGSGVSDR